MLNVVVLIGRIARDPELRYTPSGIAVTSFAVAVDRRFKSQQSEERETDFIDIVAWRQSAEFAANYLTKGRLIAVEGRLQTRSWVAQDGTKRYKTEVVAYSLRALDKPKDQAAAAEYDREESPASVAVEPEGAEFQEDFDPFAEE